MKHRRKRSRRHVKCTHCTPNRWGNGPESTKRKQRISLRDVLREERKASHG